ncbi:MAG: hypothetical protein HS116_02150 [Planctomycetes bacterium]|nr:hypothetical protein [Planctomycetota bacterium]
MADRYIQADGILDLGLLGPDNWSGTVMALVDLPGGIEVRFSVGPDSGWGSLSSHLTTAGTVGGVVSTFFDSYPAAETKFIDAACDPSLAFTVFIPGPVSKCQTVFVSASPTFTACGGPLTACASIANTTITRSLLNGNVGAGWYTAIEGSALNMPAGSGFTCQSGEGSKVAKKITYRIFNTTSGPTKPLTVKVRHTGVASACGVKALLGCATISDMAGSGGEGEFAEVNLPATFNAFVDVVVGYYPEGVDEECCGISPAATWSIQFNVTETT